MPWLNSGSLPTERKWRYADLRSLDGIDGSLPGQDMIALYYRQGGDEGEIRLDFFELESGQDTDIYLALDSVEGGTQRLPISTQAASAWDVLLVIPAEGEIYALDSALQPVSLAPLRVLRNADQDTITVHWQGDLTGEAGSPTRLNQIEVFTTAPQQTQIADQLGPAAAWGTPPPPGRVLFTFWDTYPAYTPALALRRWDGAHTGPLGGRHGLFNLLRTAANRSVPLVLLDLKEPAALSGLDYLGVLEQVRGWVAAGSLLLPEALPGFHPPASASLEGLQAPPKELLSEAARQSRPTDQKYQLPPSPFVFIPQVTNLTGSELPQGTEGIFTFADQPPPVDFPLVRPVYWGNRLVLSLPWDLSGLGFDERGPTAETKSALVRHALQSGLAAPWNGSILALGGSLPASPLGNPQVARAAFRYIENHPWIRVLDQNNLLSLPPDPHSQAQLPLALQNEMQFPQNPVWLTGLQQGFSNNLELAAWQAYRALYASVPPNPAPLPNLRQVYQGIVPSLLDAAAWVEKPSVRNDCFPSLDGGNSQKCVLSNEHLWAQLDPKDGSLSLLVSSQGHQLIGPSFQLISGLSEAASWEQEGSLADPLVQRGAFTERGATANNPWQVTYEPGEIRFTHPSGGIEKSYQLLGNTLVVQVEGQDGVSYSIPVTIDPWQRFEEGWRDQITLESTPEGAVWQTASGLRFELTSNTSVSVEDSTLAQTFFAFPEDPNLDFPAGFFLPIPSANAQVSTVGPLEVRLVITPEENS